MLPWLPIRVAQPFLPITVAQYSAFVLFWFRLHAIRDNTTFAFCFREFFCYTSAMRVITKVGDVFETTDKTHLLQLVAIDYNQLNSDVIVVYKAQSLSNLDALREQKPLFYHHSTVSEGVKQGLWHKIGKASLPDVSKLTFKTYFPPDDISVMQQVLSKDQYPLVDQPHWAVWTPLSKDWKYTKDRAGLRLKAEDGAIVPPVVIAKRIQHGGKTELPRDYPGQSIQPRLHHVIWLDQGLNETTRKAVKRVENGEWFVAGKFSLYDAYNQLYNKIKPFYKRAKGNQDGDLGYMFAFIACSEGFPKVAPQYFSYPAPKVFLTVKSPVFKDIREALRLKVGHSYFKTLEELREHLLTFADVSELDDAIGNLGRKAQS